MADGKPGRPATGQTRGRSIRIGGTWDRAEELALELARRNGTVRRKPDGTEHGNVTAYVEQALREHNARTERKLQRDQ